MFRNYIKVALRNIVKTKLHSFITVSGLATGIACCIFIILFVKDEWTFDRFHQKADRIYRAWVFEDYGEDEQFFNATTPYPLGPALKENFNEVATFVRYNQVVQSVIAGIDTYTENISVVGPDFFDVFDYQVIEGKLSGVLNEKEKAVITESRALKLFGTTHAIGETIALDFGSEQRLFTIGAVVNDPPTNTAFQIGIVISDLNNDILVSERALASWFNVDAETYVVLKPGVDKAQLEAKFPTMIKQIMGEEYVADQYNIGLQPLTDIHLNTEMPVGIAPVSDPKYAYILTAIAFLILLLGSINFVTLSIARSVNRNKEVGVRKVVGAQRKQLIFQFLSETFVTALIATVIGVGLGYLLLPYFNELAGKHLELTFSAFNLASILGLLLIIGIVAGSYPAFVLSGFQPSWILKSGTNKKSSSFFKKSLVVIQFALTIFLLSSAFLMQKQLRFLQEKNLGFNKEHVLISQLTADGDGLLSRIGNAMDVGRKFKTELEGREEIKGVTLANHVFGSGGWTNVGYTTTEDVYRTFDLLVVDYSFIPKMEIELLDGRNFSQENTSDSRRSIIVNEAFADEYGWDDAIGKRLPGNNFEDHEVIGVVKDFNYSSLHGEVGPLILVLDPAVLAKGIENIGIGSNPIPKLWVRLSPDKMQQGIQAVESSWQKIMGDEEFIYSFVDQTLAEQYTQERNLSEIVSVATLLALIIGSMGLFALASLNMANRTKEISIRKILGASQKGLLILLSKEYLIIIGTALIIAIPASIYIMYDWLQGFAYRTSIGVGGFILTAIIAIVVALASIGYQAIITARKQPAETLKYE